MREDDKWQAILEAARSIDCKYQALDRERLGRIWSNTEFLAACATDWGELAEAVMVNDGMRKGEADPGAIRHELSDMLWALIVLSDRLGIDLAEAFMETMEELEERFS
jgi:hypothetical protein